MILLSLRGLRLLIPLLGIGFLIREGQEVFALRQLTSITLFASFYLVANYQMAVGRTMSGMDKAKLAGRAARSSGLMFIATLFSALDAALDTIIKDFALSRTDPVAVVLFVSGWLINLLAVLMAVVSMHRFLPVLKAMVQAPSDQLTSP